MNFEDLKNPEFQEKLALAKGEGYELSYEQLPEHRGQFCVFLSSCVLLDVTSGATSRNT